MTDLLKRERDRFALFAYKISSIKEGTSFKMEEVLTDYALLFTLCWPMGMEDIR